LRMSPLIHTRSLELRDFGCLASHRPAENQRWRSILP
jgi:hypothetical protein